MRFVFVEGSSGFMPVGAAFVNTYLWYLFELSFLDFLYRIISVVINSRSTVRSIGEKLQKLASGSG